MADTPRTLSAILSLFADNSIGAISPQDLRDYVVSERDPLSGGGFDVIAAHQAFGPDATTDQTMLGGVSENVLTVAEDFTSTNAVSPAQLGVGIVVNYTRSAAFDAGDYAPNIVGLFSTVTGAQTTGTEPDNNNSLWGVYGAATHSGSTMGPFSQAGTIGEAVVSSGAAQKTGGQIAGVSADLDIFGTTPSAPFAPGIVGRAIETGMFSARTGTYSVASVYLRSPTGAGVMSDLYGLYIEPHTKGSSSSANIYSAGATSKNRLDGYLIAGAGGGFTNANAAAGVVTDLGGAVLRIGDAETSQTFSNGIGIKFHDSGQAHMSMKFVGPSHIFSIGDSSSSSTSLALDTTALTLDTQNGRLSLPVTGSGAGLLIGGDTNLYRLSADLLATDDAFYSATGVFAGPNGGSTNQISLTANGVREFYGGETQPRVHLSRDNGTSGGGGLAFGPGGSTAPDTNLYRAAANQLATDDSFAVYGDHTIYQVAATSSNPAFRSFVSGDSVERFSIEATGLMEWGTGSASRDTNLYRASANALATDDSFAAAGNIEANSGGAETAWIGSVGPGSKAGLLLGYSTAGYVSLYHDSPGVLKTGDNLIVAGHSAFGNDAEIDPGPITGNLTYGATSTVITAAEDWQTVDDGTGVLLSGMYAYASFNRSTAFPASTGDPSMAAVVGKTTWEPTSGATGSTITPGVMHGGFFGVDHQGGVPLSFAVGVEGDIQINATKGTDYGSTSVRASGAFLGISADDPGDFVGLDAHLYTQRTGANYDATIAYLFFHPSSTGTPANLYGLRIGAMTAASTANYNILSEGTTTKNKFQGRVFEGTPNSAPTDADIDNGQITAYLDQSGNKIKWRARYSDGTLKTGEVALT